MPAVHSIAVAMLISASGAAFAQSSNPFTYGSLRDQQLACYGISIKWDSNCRDIVDFDDRQMCYALSGDSQTPCTLMSDRNLQLACYGMSIGWPSNCRDITDAGLQSFCYGVSTPDPGQCSLIADGDTQSLCTAMALGAPSYCDQISGFNDRLFCHGVTERSQTPCISITDPPPVPTCTLADGYPMNPPTGQPVCPPYNNPIVFMHAHPDDETIGMAGSIRQAVNAGRTVIIELMTHGTASYTCQGYFANGSSDAIDILPGGAQDSHHYPMTADDCGNARVREWTAAMAGLGVSGIRANDFYDSALTVAQVNQRINFWVGVLGNGFSLRSTAGNTDTASDLASCSSLGTTHPDHLAVWQAAAASSITDVAGHMIYVYDHQGAANPRCAGATVDVTSVCADRQSANDKYRVWDPANGRFAVGKHSTQGLFDTSRASCSEYLVYRGQP